MQEKGIAVHMNSSVNKVNHLDGSACKNRKSMPKKSQIAYYWREQSFKYFNYLMDPGEPSCWACGKWHSDCPEFDKRKSEDAFESWNKHSYLDRCHIIPKAHKGCNCEANLVLLCKGCHKASPDTFSTETFKLWVTNRSSWAQLNYLKFQQVTSDLSYEPQDNDHKIFLSESFINYYTRNAIPVGGKIPISTRFACLIEFKKQTTKSEIEKICKDYDIEADRMFINRFHD